MRECVRRDSFRRVIQVATESNIERLRQAALLLERENERLHRRLQELVAELAKARGAFQTEQLALEIQLLQEQLAQRNRKLFGRSSERRSGSALPTPPAAPTPRRGHGPTEQPALPLVEVVHELDEPDRQCPACGGALQAMAGQFEEAQEIDVVERSFRLVRHKRQKYRCRCGECVETALGPTKLVPGGRYAVGFAAEVAIQKYLDHQPLARQTRAMARQGLGVEPQTLWDQLEALARPLAPSYQALHRHVLEAPVVGADETSWKLFDARQSRSWWAWSVTREDAVFYRIARSRSAEAAGELLAGYHGVVMCDGYSAYPKLARDLEAEQGRAPFVLAHCWAHVRRKYVEAEPHYPEAQEVLALLAELYAVEAEAGGDLERRRALREARSRPIVAGIGHFVATQRTLPESSLGRALRYTDEIWPGLVRFLDDPRIPLDNNATERAMRGVAIGRKNHYGSRSQRGTQVAALFYSLLESAKLAGIGPALYLREAARRAILAPGTVTLPHQLLAET